MSTTATMVYGLGETTAERVQHLLCIRDLQDRTGGFRAFIPWSLQANHTRLVEPPQTGVDYLRMVALSRLVLDNVDHIQAGWVTEGPYLAQIALTFGADDFGGVLMEESVVKATGISHAVTVEQVVSLIRETGMTPAQRNTEYRMVRTFEELNRRVNIQGTANLLRLAGRLHVPFCHLSTAYVAGRREGRVFEGEIDVGQEFNNPYESSKCRAELLVRDWARRTGLAAFIFRPSIVVGDSQEGRIVHFDGLYNFMRLLDGMAGLNGGQGFRVVANPAATKNIVPVDYVAHLAMHILDGGVPGLYHVTSPHPLRLSVLRDILAPIFGVHGARLVSAEEFQNPRPNQFESMYQRLASSYAPYLATEPIFDRTNTDAAARGVGIEVPKMDTAFFRRLVDYARKVHWGKAERPAAPAAAGRERFVERYFDSFLTEKMHKQLLPNLRRLSANCRILVEDIPGRSWSLSIDQGCLVKISENGMPCPCTFLLHSDVFSAIVSGRLSPQAAFFNKRISIEGDIETGLKLATVLATFFRKWPYE